MSDLQHEFEAFHEANPHVYRLFTRFALEAARAGRSRFSARTIWHRIRWYTTVETSSEDGFKLNDHHSPYYARMFLRDHPEHAGLFELRAVKGEREHAPEPAPVTGEGGQILMFGEMAPVVTPEMNPWE